MATRSNTRKWPWLVGIVVTLVIAVIAAMFFTGTDIKAITDKINPPPTVKIDDKVIGKDDTGAEIRASSSAAPNDLKAKPVTIPRNLQPVGLEKIKLPKQPWHFTELTPRGKLAAPVQIELPLDREAKKGETVLVAVNHTHRAGDWKVVETSSITEDRKHVTFVVNELSWFTPLWEDVVGLGNEIKAAFLDGFSDGLFAEAKPPTCPSQDSKALQDNYQINVEDKSTVKACIDIVEEKGVPRDEQLRVIKIVNMVKYPLEIKHTNVTVTSRGKNGLDLAELANLGDHLVIQPGDEATFSVRLKHDTKATIDTDVSKLALGLHAVDILVKAILTVLTKIDVQGIASKAEVLETVLGGKECANVLFDLNIGSILANCLNDGMLKALFNWKAAVLGPVMLFFSSMNLGYAMANAWDDSSKGKSKQNVIVTRPKPNPYASILLPNGVEWTVHTYGMTIQPDGSASSSENAGPCDVDEDIFASGPRCTEHLTYSLKPLGNGKFRGTVTSKWHTTDSGERYDYKGDFGRDIGDTFTINRNAKDSHLLDWIWDDAANNSSTMKLCDPYAAQRNNTEQYQLCGA